MTTDTIRLPRETVEAVKEALNWRQIPWAKTGYMVSDNGKIKSPNKILATRSNSHGYQSLSLKMKGGKTKFSTVHGIVALAFLGKRPDGLEVAHLDGNKENNHLSNLKYVTQLENNSHMDIHGTRPLGERHGRHKLSESDVLYIRKSWIAHDKICGTRLLARKFGVDPATIRRALQCKNWTHDLRNAAAALADLEKEIKNG